MKKSDSKLIDKFGFRANVGIILINKFGKVLWARRYGEDSWQFPQGGIDSKETPEIAMFRELEEEIGLLPFHVEVLGQTKGWLKYRLPKKFLSKNKTPFKGQKQKWFITRFIGDEKEINLKTQHPEFIEWKWILPDKLPEVIVNFKKEMYIKLLKIIKEFIG